MDKKNRRTFVRQRSHWSESVMRTFEVCQDEYSLAMNWQH